MTDRTFIIAEAGVNHNGSLDLALRLVDAAAEAGADAVKFQTFKAELLATAQAAKASYQISNTKEEGSQLAMLRALELKLEDHHALIEHCRARDIRFMSTAFDAPSLAFLGGLGMPAIKIPSGDITCAPLLLQAAQLRQRLLVSSGMSTLTDLERALAVLAWGLLHDGQPSGQNEIDACYFSVEGQEALRNHVTLLHCVTQYPAPPEAVNLRAMDTMAQAFGLPVGYSDHTLGSEMSIAAVARGAVVIEKHFTLDRSLPGPDHLASLEPSELKHMVSAIRNVELALGSARKLPALAEHPNRSIGRRSIVARHPIAAGEILTLEMLDCKRPGAGMSPMDIWSLVGRPAARAFAVDEQIEP
ncbi:N-acetylneuraminate synthase [Chromobacterium violaceum]|uniref:N-acetylneuraminate synthase n=1 Tax=Chromobacterium violaceum TaxID=536 RepID=UPI0009DAE7C0|nr:N-acetylneuraminate synthase [Chromobacterium violaceum]OQS08491.1 N-acetylneuraminate synthase [Chromobacterium violaceum]OQS21687.1 N-acetylneuraminate synthase [Chromobacterium violaceum]